MARILLATLGSYGDVNPYLALGRELKRRGHSVVLSTSSFYRADAEREGLDFAPMRPEADPADKALMAALMDPRSGSETVVRGFVMPAVRDSYEDLEKAARGADLLVSHMLTYAVPLLAEKTGRPWVSTVLQPLLFFSPHDPPVVPNAPWLAALRPFGPAVNSAWIAAAKVVSRGWAAPVRALRRDLGLPPGPDPLFHGHVSPHGMLALFSAAFGPPQPDWPRGVKVCGFPFLDSDIGGARSLDPALSAFLEAGPPPLVFTLGSFAVNVAGEFYARAAEAANRLGRRAVLLAGPAADAMTGLPSGVVAARSAPYHLLFPRAAAVVHSGGVGTTAQALRGGRPQVVVPHAHDQFDNGARVERLGAGRVVLPSRLVGGRLERVLGPLLEDAGARRRAAEIGSAIAGERGVENACDAIEAALPARTAR